MRLTEDISFRPRAVLCFCHLRWNFVYQRPQHLLSRFNQRTDVHLWEEPVFEERDAPELRIEAGRNDVRVITPLIPEQYRSQSHALQKVMLDSYLAEHGLHDIIAWYYTPMALAFSDHLAPAVTVYDCMDELSAFQGAPPELINEERRLFRRADVVFTGGASLFSSKRNQHSNVHLFPSSIDREHFASARTPQQDPSDQAHIPHPRIGLYGVLDERLDCSLLADLAKQHPEWSLVLIGPVVKIGEDALPRAANIHYLGQKDYNELPQYLANWDIAMLPFALNASTRFISPTKTPEYLAAGKPVISTPIQDVAEPYGRLGLVKIAANAAEFASAAEAYLDRTDRELWLEQVDKFLAHMSWNETFERMWKEIQQCFPARRHIPQPTLEQRSGTDV